MRLRTKKNLEPRIEKCSYLLIDEPAQYKGIWLKTFGGSKLHLEIGCGKGSFVCGMAAMYPDVTFIAIERVRNVIVTAMEKADKAGLKNVHFINANARELTEFFDDGEIDRIYLNFSDPWPKTRHEKNRLTSSSFMPTYIKLLTKGGEIHQKTDNRQLFDFSLDVYKEYGCTLTDVSYDLHKDGMEGNVVTEYEQRFVDLGQPIHRVVVHMPE
ncbi:MAG: tRNA (guanosine(46)-N7)-methyltransferase TrmB [Clostridia bacterium]|nr:tRNA (guanosine(46)-N7)-methyltransferase TrmB [Clostridia bacterium]